MTSYTCMVNSKTLCLYVNISNKIVLRTLNTFFGGVNYLTSNKLTTISKLLQCCKLLRPGDRSNQIDGRWFCWIYVKAGRGFHRPGRVYKIPLIMHTMKKIQSTYYVAKSTKLYFHN